MENLESKVITTDSGTDVKETKMLKGGATKTKAESATNSPTKYDTGSAPSMGPLGGRNKRN